MKYHNESSQTCTKCGTSKTFHTRYQCRKIVLIYFDFLVQNLKLFVNNLHDSTLSVLETNFKILFWNCKV